MYIKLEEKEHMEILLVFRMLFRQQIKFQMSREVDGIEIFKMSRDIAPENSDCISNRLFTRIGAHFRYV